MIPSLHIEPQDAVGAATPWAASEAASMRKQQKGRISVSHARESEPEWRPVAGTSLKTAASNSTRPGWTTASGQGV